MSSSAGPEKRRFKSKAKVKPKSTLTVTSRSRPSVEGSSEVVATTTASVLAEDVRDDLKLLLEKKKQELRKRLEESRYSAQENGSG